MQSNARRTPPRALSSVCVLLICALTAACSSDDGDDTKPPSAVSAKDACLALADTSVDAAEISLPTSGARVESVAFVEADAERNGNGEYCEVNGAISPVDPEAPDIKFRANFPTEWNSKALQLGGGGYNGNIPNTKGKVPLGLDTAPTPLALGYITFASDSGHQAPDSNDASFAQ